MARAGLQIAVFLAVLTALAVQLGAHLQRLRRRDLTELAGTVTTRDGYT